MTSPGSLNFEFVVDHLRAWRRPVLFSHTKPDGDALGSLLAMRAMLGHLGISATAVVLDAIPARYEFLNHENGLVTFSKEVQPGDLGRFDSVVVLDTCTYNQLEPVADWLRACKLPKLAVDHHR